LKVEKSREERERVKVRQLHAYTLAHTPEGEESNGGCERSTIIRQKELIKPRAEKR
jgi:hypothetical protein